jgi:DNA excision repair protein ERCC-2
VKISVRNLVEFILRSGDIDTSKGSQRDTDAMQEGSRIHRKIQKSMGTNYSAEVSLSITVPVNRDGNEFDICVEGRADGVLIQPEESTSVIIDEIKGVYLDLAYLQEPIGVHRAQVMCYGYIYAKNYELNQIGIRLTYCNLDTEVIKYFEEILNFDFLEKWFLDLIQAYAKWASWQNKWVRKRNESIKKIEFPFEYRKGQKELVTGVYRTIIRSKKLYIEAPTGVGKTISTVFPAVKSMGEEQINKIFYLTAKTITRTVAEETFQLFIKRGMKMKVVTITAKDKICIFDKADCNPRICERAKGHYDRVNDGVFDLLTSENEITRELLIIYAKKHCICPFEMSLDITLWADSIICDYNYIFDPNVYLRRFFSNEKKNDYVFLIDEAHNLVERAREMYSALLYKQKFLHVKHILAGKNNKLEKTLEKCNKEFLKLKRECDEFEVVERIEEFILQLMRIMGQYEDFLQENLSFVGRDEVLELYFEVRHFMNIYDTIDEKYIIYTDYDEKLGFRIKLQCMDPSSNLEKCVKKGKSAIFFSATLLPIKYYKDQLAGNDEDYAVYASSAFDTKNRLLMIGKEVSTKYSKRTKSEYMKILEYINIFIKAKVGNYLVFFPSYQFMDQVAKIAELDETFDFVIQKSNMSEGEREDFLSDFIKDPKKTRVAFCVMGGLFSEGIDLKDNRLIGAVIVGTGLPMICNERELFRNYYNEKNGDGFAYAYLYNGMNKVLQSAGRVIRTAQDRGVILLLDERFQNSQYQKLFPNEWFPNTSVTRSGMQTKLEEFWRTN